MVTVRSHYFYLDGSQVVNSQSPQKPIQISSSRNQFLLVQIPRIRNKTTSPYWWATKLCSHVVHKELGNFHKYAKRVVWV